MGSLVYPEFGITSNWSTIQINKKGFTDAVFTKDHHHISEQFLLCPADQYKSGHQREHIHTDFFFKKNLSNLQDALAFLPIN